MIEKMKFISISGPKDDLDRVVNQVLSRYPIQFEHALTELKSASRSSLVPYPGGNPYRDPYQKAARLIKRLSGGRPDPGGHPSMEVGDAVSLVDDTLEKLAASQKKREELLEQTKSGRKLLEQIELYQELDFDIPAILKFTHIKYRFGRIQKELYPQLERFAVVSKDVILYKCHETDRYVSLIYFTPAVLANRIDAMFVSLQFEKIFLPDRFDGTPKEETERLKKEIDGLERMYRELEDADASLLSARSRELFDALSVLKSYNDNADVHKYAACIHDDAHPYYLLCGWIPSGQADALREELSPDKKTFFVFEDSRLHRQSAPPTRLKNLPFFRPFELFVRMYGLPAYGEFDPTIVVAVTYSLFFGFMFGDLGQGLLLLAGGFLLYKWRGLDLAAIVSCCGFFSAVFGLLFGSVFGFEDVLPALWLHPAKAMTNLPFVGRLNTVFVVAIALGMFMILFTMLMNMLISFKNHDPEKTWLDTNGLAGFVFYAGLAAVIGLFMTGRPVPATGVLLVLFVLPLLLIFLKEPLSALLLKRRPLVSGGIGMFFVEGFFELFEVLLSYFSNTLSFVRVGAFAVSHAAMMEVVLMLAGAESGSLNPIVVVLGNLFVCGMEGLIVGIQVLRLEYYELFSRFYQGTGREFKPFYQK